MRSAWLRIGGVALLALAIAVAVVAGVERLRPDLARPPPEPFQAFPMDRVDAEVRLSTPTLDRALRWARDRGIDRLVSLTGGFFGNGLETQLAAAARHPHQVKVLMNLDASGCCGEDWSAREAARVASGRAAGAAGLYLEDPPGPLDGAALDRVLAQCLQGRLPVAVRLRGPADVAALSRIADRRPELPLVALGLDLPPAEVTALLSRHPALHVALGVRLATFAGDPAGARAAVLAHPDRFLFGTSVEWALAPPDEVEIRNAGRTAQEVRDFYAAQYRFLETRDAGIPVPGGAAVGGLGLPRAALRALYHRNAERVFGFGGAGG